MLTLTRPPDWQDRLLAELAADRSRAFCWGTADCATLFAAAVEAVAGIDPLAAYRPWASERDAMRVLAGSGFASFQDFTAAMFPQIPVASARRGDLGDPATAGPLAAPYIVTGSEAVQRGARGWLTMPLTGLATAYRVG
jgi:hypothetical protein